MFQSVDFAHPAAADAVHDAFCHAIESLRFLSVTLAIDLCASQILHAACTELEERQHVLDAIAARQHHVRMGRIRRLAGRHKPHTSRRAVLEALCQEGRPDA